MLKYRLPIQTWQNFNLVTICFQHRFKMSRELGGEGGDGGGFRMKNYIYIVLDSGLPFPLLKQGKTQQATASFGDMNYQ